jgi:transposase InsO family protein
VTASQDAALDRPHATFASPQHHSLTVGVLQRPVESAQYTAGVYTKALEVAGLRQSMGQVATCFDNAACESLFATLKTELVHTRTSTEVVPRFVELKVAVPHLSPAKW